MRRYGLGAMVTVAALVAGVVSQPGIAVGDAGDRVSADGATEEVELQVLDLSEHALPMPPALPSNARGEATLAGLSPAAIDPGAVYAGFNTVNPDRILDTRASGAVGPKGVIGLQVAGRSVVPANATSVIMNVTAVDPTGGGYLTVWPADQTQPNTSSLNMAPLRTVANLVVVKLSATGAVNIYNDAGQTHVLADVVGWSANDGHFVGLPPNRVLDTRPTGQVGTNSSINVAVLGRAGVPATGVKSVVVNVTVTNPTAGGYVTVWPTGSPQPNASNLNFVANQTVPNLVFAQVGADGQISLFNEAGTTDLLIDVVGYVADGAAYVPLNPVRLMDTRTGLGDYGLLQSNWGLVKTAGPIGPNQAVTLDIGGNLTGAIWSSDFRTVAGVVLNVTGVAPSSNTYLTVSPGAAAVPNTSTVNLSRLATVPNAVVVQPGTRDLISIYNAFGNVDVIVDLVGIIPRQHPDDALDVDGKSKYHVVYVQGSDSFADPNVAMEQIRNEVNALDGWFAAPEQANGRHFNIDREAGQIEVDFIKYQQFTRNDLVNWEQTPDFAVLRKLVDDGYGSAEGRVALVYLDGDRELTGGGTCGIRILQFTTVFMENACSDVNGTITAEQVGGFQGQQPSAALVAIHEMIHGLGAVPSCAPSYVSVTGGHVGTYVPGTTTLVPSNEDPQRFDLMYPYLGSNLLPKRLDIDRNDYFDHSNPNCPDVADSPFIS